MRDGLWFGTLKDKKASHMEREEQTFGNVCWPTSNNGTQRALIKWALLVFSLSHAASC